MHSMDSISVKTAGRSVYHAACKDEHRDPKLVELRADAFRIFS